MTNNGGKKMKKKLQEFLKGTEISCILEGYTLFKMQMPQGCVVFVEKENLSTIGEGAMYPAFFVNQDDHCVMLYENVPEIFRVFPEIDFYNIKEKFQNTLKTELYAYFQALQDSEVGYREEEVAENMKIFLESGNGSIKELTETTYKKIPFDLPTFSLASSDLSDATIFSVEQYFQSRQEELAHCKSYLEALRRVAEVRRTDEEILSSYPTKGKDLHIWFQTFFKHFSGKTLWVTYELNDGSRKEVSIKNPTFQNIRPYFQILSMRYGRKTVYERTKEMEDLKCNGKFQGSILDDYMDGGYYTIDLTDVWNLIPNEVKEDLEFWQQTFSHPIFYKIEDHLPDKFKTDFSCFQRYVDGHKLYSIRYNPFHAYFNRDVKAMCYLVKRHPDVYEELSLDMKKKEEVVETLAQSHAREITTECISSSLFSTKSEQDMIRRICKKYPDFYVNPSLIHLSLNPKNIVYCLLKGTAIPVGFRCDTDFVMDVYDHLNEDFAIEPFYALFEIERNGYKIEDPILLKKYLIRAFDNIRDHHLWPNYDMIKQTESLQIQDTTFWIDLYRHYENRNFYNDGELNKVIEKTYPQLSEMVQLEIVKNYSQYFKIFFSRIGSYGWKGVKIEGIEREVMAKLIREYLKRDSTRISEFTSDMKPFILDLVKADPSIYELLSPTYQMIEEVVKELMDKRWILPIVATNKRFLLSYQMLNNKEFIEQQMKFHTNILQYLPEERKNTGWWLEYIWNDISYIMNIIKKDPSNLTSIPVKSHLWNHVEFAKAVVAFRPKSKALFPEEIQKLL